MGYRPTECCLLTEKFTSTAQNAVLTFNTCKVHCSRPCSVLYQYYSPLRVITMLTQLYELTLQAGRHCKCRLLTFRNKLRSFSSVLTNNYIKNVTKSTHDIQITTLVYWSSFSTSSFCDTEVLCRSLASFNICLHGTL